ncbi:MAG TPA: hypothetical protein VFR77_08150, partial [Steroidobacteraceae bacterium]|nr:hypothetical protein [Steroidobacteraceae bacterium]
MNDPGEYARQVERYLCQKNRGHLIRVVGPAFEMVCGWATTGVPLKIALRGIDRCCERLEARGPRRRPVRIEFCESDVLDAFDDWRRAVGVTASTGQDQATEPEPRKPALSAHIERVIARLAHARGAGRAESPVHHRIDQLIRELEALAPSASRVRGEARATVVATLAQLDRALIDAAVAQLDGGRRSKLRDEAA